MSPDDSSRPYVTITGDTPGGAQIDAYREYLDPQYRGAFDEWRASYKNPSKKHLGKKKVKNWDTAVRRADLEGDGVIAEVIFPNTVPPFYGKAFHVSAPPTAEQYRRWRAGTRAHNRWMSEFCQEEPERRAGIGLIHLNELDDAMLDVVASPEQSGDLALDLEPVEPRRLDRLVVKIKPDA